MFVLSGRLLCVGVVLCLRTYMYIYIYMYACGRVCAFVCVVVDVGFVCEFNGVCACACVVFVQLHA